MGNIFSIQCGDAVMGRCWDCIAKKSMYVSKLEDNLVALEAARDQLTELRNDVMRTIINQQTPLMEQPDQVGGWLSRVDDAVAQVNGMLTRGEQERHNLCMAGFCSKKCISSYKFGKSVAQSLVIVNALMAEADFKQVVVTAPAKQLESNLEELRNAKEDLHALKEDLLQRISMEEGPEKRRLNQVQAWLSKAETLVAEADQLMKDGPQELNKLLAGDISNSIFCGRVARILEDIVSLHSKENFSQVTTEAVPRRVVRRNQKPTVGTQEMLQEAWSVLHKVEVGIIGVYGMGGVGKTTLLTQINNKFVSSPNDFDIVIWVVVSKDLKLDSIQESIWKHFRSVDDRWSRKSFQEKAQDIFDVLQGKKFILLLDDVWQQFDLEEIGVPLPTKQNGSKVVFTTRSFTVCKQMEATQTMKVKPLNPEESWQLFEEKVGKIDAGILHVAQKVAEECCGLPIALITIGRAMASRSTLEEWEHALKVLRRSVSNLQGKEDELYQDMEVRVFKRLKFSYDSLPNNRLQSCFLYCALFPEDFKILKHDLVLYWVAEKFCGRHEGYGIVYTLIRQCLLEDAGEYVKLHDVVRDMALWTACECEKEEHKFFTQAGAGLIQLPEDGEWEGAEKVSFMSYSFTSIEGRPRCCDLLTLFLSHNAELRIISQDFFQLMTRLTVLDLSYTEIKEFPLELCNLQSLELLNLSYTRLKELPSQMKRLVSLKYLNLGSTPYIKMIPVGVISNLSKLQVLNMFKCGSSEYRKEADNVLSDCNMLIKELTCLKNLSELSLTVRSASFLHHLCSNQKLLSCIRALRLKDNQDTKSLDISSLGNAKQLHLLNIVLNPSLEEVVIEERETQAPSSSLNNNLLIFCGLREVCVIGNDNMLHLTWLAFVPQLTILRAGSNENMEEIIRAEKLSEHQASGEQYSNMFAKLQVLDLYDLRNLKTICPVALSFPCLSEIEVRECPALKKLPLKAESAEGCNVVIKAEESWWNELSWEDDRTQTAFSSCFQKI